MVFVNDEAIALLSDHILMHMDKGNSTQLILVAKQTAFDILDHPIFLSKLPRMAFSAKNWNASKIIYSTGNNVSNTSV